MSYCVVFQDGQWRLALLAGRRKDVQPGSFRRVRQACREASRLNMPYDAASSPRTPEILWDIAGQGSAA